MKHFWDSVQSKFSALSEREKWLISVCGAVGLVLIMLTFFVEPAIKAEQAAEARLTSLRLSTQQLEAEVLLATAKLKKDPDQDVNVEFKRLFSQSQDLSMELAKIVENLVPPSEMSTLLEEVLTSSHGLTLISLESMRAESIVSSGSQTEVQGYYLHPVKIELTGKYFDILKYMEALESLPVSYYWRSFKYSVDNYPDARLTLEVYTLGTRQEFIGG